MSKSVPSIPRMSNEPSAWYSRFVSYCLMGPGRSVLRLFNDEREKAGKGAMARSLPGAWQKMIVSFRWRERAAQYDLATAEAEREQQNQLRESERRKRLDLLKAFRKRINAALSALVPGSASLGQVASAVRVLCSESREEFELAELDRRLAELEAANPSNDELLDDAQRRFRAEMRRLSGGRDADAA